MTQYWFGASSEEFLPTDMVEQAKAAEQAGFDGLAASDHFAPWWPEGRASQAWVTLAAMGQVTTKPLGTSVTPVQHHYHPGVIAQAWMSLAERLGRDLPQGGQDHPRLRGLALGPPRREVVRRREAVEAGGLRGPGLLEHLRRGELLRGGGEPVLGLAPGLPARRPDRSHIRQMARARG